MEALPLPIKNVRYKRAQSEPKHVFLSLLPSCDAAPAVLVINSAFGMLDMKEWSQRLQTDVHQAEYERLNLSVQLASISLLYYDYLLTFIDEVDYIWSQPRKLTTLFYVLCRYYLLANPVYFLSVSTQLLDCSTGYLLSGVLSIFGHMGIIAVWGLRTSAIYDKHRIVSIFLGLLGTSVIILLIIRAPFNQCHGPVKFQWLRGALAATMLFYELAAWLLAVLRAWRTVREDAKFWDNPKQSLNYIIFSQGLVYITAVALLSVTTLALNFEVNLIFSRLLNSIKVPLSGVLTSRFLIALRKWERSRHTFDSKNTLPSYDPTVSANIYFTNGPCNNTSPPQKSGIPSGSSVIRELGRDIGPKPKAKEMLGDCDGDDDTLGMEDSPREERRVSPGKARASYGHDAPGPSPSASESPASALFSPNGNLSRRTKVKGTVVGEVNDTRLASSSRVTPSGAGGGPTGTNSRTAIS